MHIAKMLSTTFSLKYTLMTFWDILEFQFQKITDVYDQFISYLICIRIQPKKDL